MAVRRLLATGGLAVVLIGCGNADNKSNDLSTCEQAWEMGLGNAQQPGINQQNWIEECRAEGGDDLDLEDFGG